MADTTDAILRQYVMLKLADAAEHVRVLDDGSFEFTDSDVWLKVYRQILANPGITKYWSISWVRSADYWQDQFGQQCLAAEFDAVRQGTMLHRLVILADELWPESAHLPVEPIRAWIDEQNNKGLWLHLIRQSALVQQPDLIADAGIFSDAVAVAQESAADSRPLRFCMSFDATKVLDTKARWNRLKSLSVSYWEILDLLEPRE